MSVLPIPRCISNQVESCLSKRGDVLGTANIPLGYRPRQHAAQEEQRQRGGADVSLSQSTRRSAKVFTASRTQEPRISIIPMDLDRLNNEAIFAKERELQNFLKMYEFERRTDRNIVLNRIREYVERGMTAYEEDINTRREKLRDMIRNEEAQLTQELIDQVQQRVYTRTEEARKRAEEQRQQDEVNRRAVVTLKRQQQYLEACPEARDKVSREITRGVKYSNLVQILEKSTRRQEERQLDTLWHGIMLKENEAQRQREEEEKRKRKAAGRDAGLVLLEQMTGRSSSSEEARRLREQERQELEHLWGEVRAEEVRNLELERAKRLRLKRDLEEQLMLVKRRLVERARREAEVELKLKVISEEEIAKERADIAESAGRLRREVMAYMKSLEELRQEEARRNAEVEAIVEQSARDAEARRNLATKRYREERKRMLEDVLVGREKQLKEKQELERQERSRCNEEKELCRREVERDTAATIAEATKRREMALQYGQQLQTQRNEQQRMTKCLEAKMVDAEKLWYAREHEEEYQKLMEELMNAPEIITPSAFKIMLKECAARWDAEQKSPC